MTSHAARAKTAAHASTITDMPIHPQPQNPVIMATTS